MNEATMAQNPFLTRYLQAAGALLPQAVDEYLELERRWKTPRCSRPLHTDSSHRRERLSRRVDAMTDEENVRTRVFTRPVLEGDSSTRRVAASPTSACVDHTNGFGQKRETEKGPDTREAVREPDDRSQQAASTPGDAESRAERIARYKAERRRQLAEKYGGSESSRTRGPDAVETGSEQPRRARSRARESPVSRSSDDNEATLATSTTGLSSRRGQHLPSLDIDNKVNDSAAGEIALQEDAVHTNRHGRVIPHDADPAGGESLLENYTSTATYYYRRSPDLSSAWMGQKVSSQEFSHAREEEKVDDKAKMSVAEKRSLFRELERTSVELCASPSGKPRSRNAAVERRLRRNQERSRTQPVDYNPVSRINDLSLCFLSNQELSGGDGGVGEDEEGDISQLSLVEKMALFDRLSRPLPAQQASSPCQASDTRSRRTGSRYQTQPITASEVQQVMSEGGPGQWTEAVKQNFSQGSVQLVTQASSKLGRPRSFSAGQEVTEASSNNNSSSNLTRTAGERELHGDDMPGTTLSVFQSTFKEKTQMEQETMKTLLSGKLRHDHGRLGDTKQLETVTIDNPKSFSSQHLTRDQSEKATTKQSTVTQTDHSERKMKSEVAARHKEDEAGQVKQSEYYFSDQTSPTRETVGDTSPSGMATAPWRQTRLQQVTNDKQQLSSQSELISGSKTNTPSGGSNAIGKKSELPTTPSLITTTMSIKDRLSSLQKSGNEDWKNRSNKRSGDMKITRTELFKKKLGLEADSKMSISERKALISESEMAWQVRGAGAANDSVQFTVAGRMVKKGNASCILLVAVHAGLVSSLPDPLTPRSKAAESAISKPETEIIPSDSMESDKKLDKLESFLDKINTKCTLESRTAVVSVTEEVVKEVLQPDDDETFRRFYSSSTSSVAVEIREEDLDVLYDSEAPRLLSAMSEHRRSVRPARRTTASRNPIKALAQRNDIKTEYTEQRLNVATIEANRLRAQKLAKHSRLADAALAGLASKEDFSSVNLRSVATASPSSNNSALPYKPVMLLQVKGRRHVQTRLVEPRAISLNSGDCFLLLTHQHCYLWIGEFANVIEKAKASDLATYIQTKRDLGCRASSITIIEEGINCGSNRARSFWDLLGGRVSYKGTGPPEEDEQYENDVVATNCAFRLQGERLVPDDECWGKVPRCTMLNPCDVVVFDFGSEVYVWHGKEVTLAQRKVAFQLAKQLWLGPYDYNTCRINPLGSDIPRMGEGRPEWSIFGRLTQHNETVLFKEKFLDWADAMKPPKKNGDELKSPHISSITTTSPTSPMATIENMVHTSPEGGGVAVVQPQAGGTVLEGVDVGRGHGTVKGEDARAFELSTVAVEAWHVAEHGYSSVAATSRGQLHMGDAYIVKWKYMLCPAVSKRKKSEAVRSVTAGRERCAYFFWQGCNAGVSDKGASALMTIELDTEKGPQVPVQQGKEPPCFVQLFQGGMIVHRGRREELDNSQGMTRLFCVRGELVEEALLLEVVCGPAALRSRASLLLLEPRRHVLTVWHGCCCPPSSRRVARHTAKRLRDVCPPEMNIPGTTTLSLEECEEGAEPSAFWNALGGHDRMAYQSLLQDKGREGDSLKLYRTSSASGELVLVECTSNVSVPGALSAMPFLQDDLYGVEQPALFVLQTSREAYVWQGWWPVDRESTGSSKMRWDTDRRAAMEAALLLHKESSGKVKGTAAYLVYAGLEPPSFTNLFPCWESHPDVAASSQENTEVREKCTLLEDALAQLSQTTYSLAQLTTRPLPPGVDPLKLERYLTDVDFQSVLNMSREEYRSIPLWKQATLKKEVGLF
ncbi:unnamed protein product [Lampetra planeri]